MSKVGSTESERAEIQRRRAQRQSAATGQPDIAAAHGVSVSCVRRALAREQLMTRRQAVRPRCRRRYPALYAANVSVGGNAQR